MQLYALNMDVRRSSLGPVKQSKMDLMESMLTIDGVILDFSWKKRNR